MKVHIVTPHAVYNYGALLQAHALYNYLEYKGHEVYMYDFPPHKAGKSKTIKELIYKCANKLGRLLHYREIKLGEKRFDEFIKEFRISDEKDAPLYLVGSDQVWNPNNLDENFSLRFASDKSKKISYAASIGIRKIQTEDENKFKDAIERLNALSARELDTANEVERITGRKCRVDVDPTFLMSKEYWREQERPMDINSPYVLMYLLHIPKDIKDIINKAKKKYKCDVRIIDRIGFMRYAFPGTIGMSDVGPREFLWLVDNARAVITSSFHGTAFSIIFEKEFQSLVNKAAPSRINHLLQIAQINQDEEIDYRKVKANLDIHIADSKKYLEQII